MLKPSLAHVLYRDVILSCIVIIYRLIRILSMSKMSKIRHENMLVFVFRAADLKELYSQLGEHEHCLFTAEKFCSEISSQRNP